MPLAVVGGVDEAQFTTSTLAAGSHTVSAAYSGDTNVGSSSGSLPTQTVNAPALQPTTTDAGVLVEPLDGGPAGDLHGGRLARGPPR